MSNTGISSIVPVDTTPTPLSLPTVTQKGSGNTFAELKQLLKKEGLLERQPAYYTWRVILLSALLVLGIGFVLSVHVFWLQLLGAVYLAFVFTQLGLLGHEAGHRQMFHSSWKHDAVSLIAGNLLVGMSYGWWLDKHNSHHSHPNQVDMDPDIEIPFLEFTGMEDVTKISPLRQFLVKHQAWLFLPALMVVSVGLQYDSVKFLLRNKTKHFALEWFLMIAHFVLYFGFVFALLPFWQGVLFIVVHQGLTGFYLGSIFAPNHKGMPVLEQESKMDFLHRQVITSRNIYASPLADFLYGGLNYQIEHHLFPAMPRNKLKQAKPIIKAFCEKHEIPYYETSAFQSLKEILQHLHEIGAPLRKA